MKKLLLLLIAFVWPLSVEGEESVYSVDETNERMVYVVRYIQVAKENVVAYEAALAEKTQKFNVGDGVDEWFTHKILTGPRTGQYARWFGPVTWSDLDRTETTHRVGVGTPPNASRMKDPEVVFWQNNLTPLEISNGETEILEAIPGSNFDNIATAHTRFGVAQRWKIKPGMLSGKEALILEFAEVMKLSGFALKGEVSRLVSGGDYMVFESWIGFNEWGEYGKFRTLGYAPTFERVMGQGTFKDHHEEFIRVHDSADTETSVWELLPDQSSQGY